MANRVFVTGLGVVSPLGLDAKTTWKSLVAGESGIATITAFDPEGYKTTIAAEVKRFEPTDYVDRKQARRIDRFVQFALGAAIQAADDASLSIDNGNAERTGVMIASGIGGIITISEQLEILNGKGPNRVSPVFCAHDAPGHGLWAGFHASRCKGAQHCHSLSLCERSGLDRCGLRYATG